MYLVSFIKVAFQMNNFSSSSFHWDHADIYLFFYWNSRLRVIAELRHGDLFHSANIVSRWFNMLLIIETLSNVFVFCCFVTSSFPDLKEYPVLFQHRIWSGWWVICYRWGVEAHKSFWFLIGKNKFWFSISLLLLPKQQWLSLLESKFVCETAIH